MTDPADRTFDAVLLDNDGTLTDSRRVVQRAWTAWAQHHGVAAEAFGNVHGLPSRQIVARVAPHLDQDAATADIDRRELDDLDGIVALPGAAQVLEAVGDRAAVVTSASRRLAELRLGAARLTPPAVVVAAEDFRHGKPDPEPFLIAARRLGVEPGRCLVVEDAPAGIAAGRAAGCTTLGLLTTSTREELADADLLVEDLSHVALEVTPEGVRMRLAGTEPLSRPGADGAPAPAHLDRPHD